MKLSKFILGFLLLSGTAVATEVEFIGNTSYLLRLPTQPELHQRPTHAKSISLLKFRLSPKAQQSLVHKVTRALQTTSNLSENSESAKVQLGMAGVPVLDQGRYGACVTFAVTAAIDAVLNKGDYMSQLCSLQLGNYLEKNSYTLSGWNGSNAISVLSQLSIFGFVNKTKEISEGCGGLNTYPSHQNASTPTTSMTPEAYRSISEPLNSAFVGWSTIIDEAGIYSDKIDTNQLVNDVKQTLKAGDRVVFGVLLPRINSGVAGAVGQHHTPFDTWILTPQIAQTIRGKSDIDGHEMIISGYDDNAVAYDEEGNLYQGLFTLRNSWGNEAGDQGNFYMSYRYFEALVIEVNRIRAMDE